jgi:hypothetical protein
MKCNDLCHRREIDSPGALKRVLALAQERLAIHSLYEVSTISEVTPSSDTLASLSVDGPWPDFVQSDLMCASCGQRFMLRAETYHGTGGEWAPAASEGNRAS